MTTDVLAPAARAAPRTRLLLEAPILPTLLRLAAPNLGEAAARVAFITFDAVFVSWLGPDALAGVSVVFPLFLIMQTVSAGGLGAGVNAAIARALGAGRPGDAAALAGTTAALAGAIGILCAASMVPLGPALYGAMGLAGPALEAAIVYGAVVFGGSLFVWTMNLLANVARGSGNMLVPASAIVVGEAFHLLLSPALILGWGPLPRLGVAGPAVAILAAYVVGSAVLVAHLASPGALVRLDLARVRLARRAVAAVFQIGGFAALNALQFQLATFLVTGLVATSGAQAVAGYGAATRLELLLLPISFGFSSAVLAMVATCTGAGDRTRAARIARTGAVVSAGIGAVFAAIALFLPERWVGLFADDAAIVATGALYLRSVGWTYPLLGAGLALFFAIQGAGEAVRPFLVGTVRVAIAVLGGWVAVVASLGMLGLFLVNALASLAFAFGLIGVAWRVFSRPRSLPSLTSGR